jgi:hypothetical protein
MNRHPLRPGLTLAATLSLLAGCASPTVPAPAVTAGAEALGAPGAAPVEAAAVPGEAPAAAAPEDVALAPVVFEGVASYRGEPLSGYTIRLYHLGTDEAITQTPSADGLAILSQTATTDAAGRYRVELAGLQPGFDVRAAASSPQESGTLFATLTAPDAESPEDTTGQGAIDEESTFASLLTEGASRTLWAAVEPEEPASAGYRVAQKGAFTPKSTPFKKLAPAQKQVLTAKKAYKAEVAPLAKPPSDKGKYALSAAILDAANQTMKKQKAVAKVKEPVSKKALLAAETKKLNAKITQVVSQKGIQVKLTQSAVKLVTALAKAKPSSAPGPKPPSTRAPLALLGTPLAVTVAPSGLPSAVVNTGTNQAIDLETVGTSGGAALDAGFTAPSKPSNNTSQPAPLPAPVVTGVSQLTASAGTLITVTGENFSPTLTDNVVTINGATATPESVTSTKLVVAVPTDAAIASDHLSVAVRGVTAPTLVDFTVVAPGTVLSTVTGLTGAHGVVCANDGSVYTISHSNSTVSKIVNGTVVDTFATGLANPGFMTYNGTDTIWIAAGSQVRRFTIPADTFGAVVALPDASTTGSVVNNRLIIGLGQIDAGQRGALAEVDDTDTVTRQSATAEATKTFTGAAFANNTYWVASRYSQELIPLDSNFVAGTPVSVPGSSTTALIASRSGVLWGTNYTSSSVTRYKPGETATTHTVGLYTNYTYGSGPSAIAEGKDGAIWVANRLHGGSLTKIVDGPTPTITNHPMPWGASGPVALSVDPAGNVWVATYDGSRVVQFAP